MITPRRPRHHRRAGITRAETQPRPQGQRIRLATGLHCGFEVDPVVQDKEAEDLRGVVPAPQVAEGECE